MSGRTENQIEMLPRAFRPLALLWLARMLVNLGKGRRTLSSDRVDIEELLEPLSLKGICKSEKKDLPEIRRSLKACLENLERVKPTLPRRNILSGNLQRLGDLMGLNAIERDILTFLLLGRQLPALERLLEAIGDISGAYFHCIIAAAINHPVSSVQRALIPSSRLLSSGLVRLDLSSKFDFSYKVDLMTGLHEQLCVSHKNDPYGMFAGCFVPAPKPRLSMNDFPHLKDDLDILRPFLREALRLHRKGINILLHGRPGGGKTQFVRMLAADLGCELFEVSTETLDQEAIHGDQRFRSYNVSQIILHQAKSTMVLFDEVEDVFHQVSDNDHPGYNNRSGIKGWVNRSLEENPVPTFWVTNQLWVVDPAFLRRFDYILELDMPPRTVRTRILNDYLGDLAVDPAWATALADHQAVLPALVERSATVMRLAREGDPGLNVSKAMPRILGNTLEAIGTSREAPNSKVSTTPYRPEILNTDCDLIALIPGLRKQGSGRICLYGPPGTGKTAFGYYLAKELDKPILVRKASDILSKWLGESETNIARMFAEARREKSVLLIDEADSFLQERKDAHRSWEVTLVNEMLTQIENYTGIFIASTNLMDSMDSASIRRFDLKVRFDFLNPDQAMLIFEDLVKSLGLSVDSESLDIIRALPNLTPGDFAAMALQTRFLPVASSIELIKRLQSECQLKPESKRRFIGFSG